MALFNINERINTFKRLLRGAKSKDAVDILCKKEFIQLMKQGFTPNTIAKLFTQYRKEILPLYKKGGRKHSWLKGSKNTDKIKEGTEIRGLLIPLEYQKERREKTTENNRGKLKEGDGKNLTTYEGDTIPDFEKYPTLENFGQYIEKAKELLTSKNWVDIAVGIMALTGRRNTCITKTAIFKITGKSKIHIHGLLKKRGEKNDAEVTTLCEPQLLIDALEKLRNMKDFSNVTIAKAKQSANGSINRAVRRHFKNILNVGDITSKHLRYIYAEVIFQRVLIKFNKSEADRLENYAFALHDYNLEKGYVTELDKITVSSYISYRLDNEGKEYIKNNLL